MQQLSHRLFVELTQIVIFTGIISFPQKGSARTLVDFLILGEKLIARRILINRRILIARGILINCRILIAGDILFAGRILVARNILLIV